MRMRVMVAAKHCKCRLSLFLDTEDLSVIKNIQIPADLILL